MGDVAQRHRRGAFAGNRGITIRDLEAADIELSVALMERDRSAAIFPLSDVLRARTAGHPALVATTRDGEIVGVISCQAGHESAWLLRWHVAESWQRQGIGRALLEALERQLVSRGIRSLLALAQTDSIASEALEQVGLRGQSGLSYFERRDLGHGTAGDHVAALGGIWPSPELWDRIGGMDREKDLIESRIVLPLAKPELAARHGVLPPGAIILFGPPGTGKTTFAKAAAARLGWPFIELTSGQIMGSDAHSRAASLAALWSEIDPLDAAVLFIDEVEALAGNREGYPEGVAVTNELLKLIPALRAVPNRLLVCATNSIRALDPAFVRPGRFDYILPVGPPDRAARLEIWRHYVSAITDVPVDLELLAERTELFTPADVEYAAHKAAQRAFERSHSTDEDAPAQTADFLEAIVAVRPSLTPEMTKSFEDDIIAFARI